MGLDNMPSVYPCHNLAVKDDNGSIDCKKTQECGNCTWKNKFENDPMTKGLSPVYGMLGTDCWYRGKYGNSMLDDLKKYNNDFDYEIPSDFYGNSEDGIDEDTCLEMSEVMFKYTEAWSYAVNTMVKNGELPEQNKESYIKDWLYAAWWLKFVGENGDGSAIWY